MHDAERRSERRHQMNTEQPTPPPVVLSTAQLNHGSTPWRCFHCDEVFPEIETAREHFGNSEIDTPACQIAVGYVRWLEAQHRRNTDDDTEALRTIRALASEHETLRQRAEENGYARGLADAKKHPEELGLRVI